MTMSSSKKKNSALSKQVEKHARDLNRILELSKAVPNFDDGSFSGYQQRCASVWEHLQSDLLKIAVIGVIKSGKSTFVNSLLKKEVVKRGAGVMTAITTRIRKGKKNLACLYFKSWDDINLSLQQALTLFPFDGNDFQDIATTGKFTENFSYQFDIRRKKDRDLLGQICLSMEPTLLSLDQEKRPELMLIRHAFNGYETCKDYVQADETRFCFKSKNFLDHQIFTANPDHAFYLNDACLEIDTNTLDPHIEIADCQGADSTDPSQLAKVLEYIETAHLIVYCISSRVGLRQADMVLLHRIKRIGLMDQLVFINNCDFSEHENIDDLIKIEKAVFKDLSAFGFQPRLFSFSALFNLFSSVQPELKEKERTRLTLWDKDPKMVQYGEHNTRAFDHMYSQMAIEHRIDLLVFTHLNRLARIIGKIDKQADLYLDLISSDSEKETLALQKLDKMFETLSRLEGIFSHALAGTEKELKKQIESNVRHYLQTDGQVILNEAGQYIRDMAMDVAQYKQIVKQAGFKKILYLMFQDFKQQLDLYVVDQIMPEIKTFVKNQEENIIDYFHVLSQSYQIDLIDPKQIDGKPYVEGINEMDRDNLSIGDVNFNDIKKLLGLTLPTPLFKATYSSTVKATVFSGFVFKTLVDIANAFLKQRTDFSFSPTLEKTAQTIKKENEKRLKSQFNEFFERLKNTFLMPLIDAGTRNFKDNIDQRFVQYRQLQEEAMTLFSLETSEKKDRQKKVLAIKKQNSVLGHGIHQVKLSYADLLEEIKDESPVA